MRSNNGNTTSVDLRAILEGLLKADVDFILVGGLAAVIQGAPVTTIDVDIVYCRSPGNVSKLMSFLQSIDAIHRRLDNEIIEPKEEDFAGMGHALFVTRLGPLDVLASIEQGKKYEDLLEHIIEIEFRGRIMQVLDIGKLIELKKASKDLKDKQRLPVLEETLRQLKQAGEPGDGGGE